MYLRRYLESTARCLVPAGRVFRGMMARELWILRLLNLQICVMSPVATLLRRTCRTNLKKRHLHHVLRFNFSTDAHLAQRTEHLEIVQEPREVAPSSARTDAVRCTSPRTDQHAVVTGGELWCGARTQRRLLCGGRRFHGGVASSSAPPSGSAGSIVPRLDDPAKQRVHVGLRV